LFTAATVFAAAAAFAVSAHADTQPPVCEQYGFPGDVLFRQGDGFHTSFASTGTQALGRAIATNASRPTMNGTVDGGFTGPRHFDLTIRWDDGTVGRYIGDVGDDAKAYGTAVVHGCRRADRPGRVPLSSCSDRRNGVPDGRRNPGVNAG
jgi:hypothetical protein